MKRRIAFIGSVGVPNIYGGFEMFLETCAPIFVNYFERVYITCDKSRYSARDAWWSGARRIFIPLRANGMQSVLHDLFAFFAVFWRVEIIIILGVSGGLFFPLFRCVCAITGKKIIVNVDGIESRRAKFSNAKRLFIFISDKLSQLCAHGVVIDNEALRKFLDPCIQARAEMIAYPGDHVIRKLTNSAKKTNGGINLLTICRIEPENQCHILLEAFRLLGKGSYTFVGNWDSSEYGRTLREKYISVSNLTMSNPIYDSQELAILRENCDCYLHGHSVGGTNPSLVEMLFYDCYILAFNCEFNRSTAGDAIEYFDNLEMLYTKLGEFRPHTMVDRTKCREKYTRYQICMGYISMINKMLNI